MDKLREEIHAILKGLVKATQQDHIDIDEDTETDRILSLIDAQRCVWTPDKFGDWETECHGWFSFDHDMEDEFCPCCGKRVEVKDGQG